MDAFTELCVEMLSPLGPVRVRRMFGGQGVYVDGLFLAIIDDGELFLKSDDLTRERSPRWTACPSPSRTRTVSRS